MTSWPASTARAAATAESTPPDMAATTLIGRLIGALPGPARRRGRSPRPRRRRRPGSRCGRARSAASAARPPRRGPSRAARARAAARRPSRRSRSSTRCPRASSSISSESPSQPGKPRCALPGSRSPLSSAGPCRWASGTAAMTRRTRSSRSAETRAACSACCLTASSTAAAKPAIAGGSMVPLRMSRSWPPPCTSGVTSSSRRTTSAPTPKGPPTLWPVRVSASTPERANATGTAPTAWTASVCTGMPCSAAIATTSSIGWSVPTSLLAHITETSATEPGSRSTAARNASTSSRAWGSTASAHTDAPSALLEPVQRVEHRVVLDRGGQDAGPARVGGAARPVDALERQVVGLGAAGGEDDLARAAVEGLRDGLAGLLDDASGAPPGGVQRARVADLEQVRRHRLDRCRHHRRGGGVVEVDGPIVHRIDQRTAPGERRPTRRRTAIGAWCYCTTLIVPSLVGAPLASVHVNGELGDRLAGLVQWR